MVDPISFIGGCMAILGYSLRDIFEFYNKSNRKNQSLQEIDKNELIKQLADSETSSDMLSGQWKLSSWIYTSHHLPSYSVNGNLSLNPKDPTSDEWTGKMYLEYLERPTDHIDKVLRKKSPPFVASYDVRFGLEGETYSGSCHMTDKLEFPAPGDKVTQEMKLKNELQYQWRGEFTNCELLGKGINSKLSGHYFNKPKTENSSYADFEFHMRQTWRDLFNKLSKE